MKTAIKTLIATSLIALTFSTSNIYANTDLKPKAVAASVNSSTTNPNAFFMRFN